MGYTSLYPPSRGQRARTPSNRTTTGQLGTSVSSEPTLSLSTKMTFNSHDHFIQASTFCLPRLPRHLRPVWFTPATTTFPTFNQLSKELGEFIPVLCVSASKHVDQGIERRPNGFSYVQGSGDDHELWGMVVAVTTPIFLAVLFINTRV